MKDQSTYYWLLITQMKPTILTIYLKKVVKNFFPEKLWKYFRPGDIEKNVHLAGGPETFFLLGLALES